MGQGACAGYQKNKPRQKECERNKEGTSSINEDICRGVNNNNYEIKVCRSGP